jgi:uncharacterized protein YdhG (YjbR/CyaY superfamily)
MPTKPATIDAYLATLSREQRATLEKLRATLRKLLPKAEECISYGLPAFRLDGAVVAGFCARAKGYSYFPFSGSTLGELADVLEGRDRTKSALHFSAEDPLPAALVRKLVATRVAEVKSRGR